MPVEIIDILKPKNNGDFPVADAEDIAYDETTTIKAKIDAKQDEIPTITLTPTSADPISGTLSEKDYTTIQNNDIIKFVAPTMFEVVATKIKESSANMFCFFFFLGNIVYSLVIAPSKTYEVVAEEMPLGLKTQDDNLGIYDSTSNIMGGTVTKTQMQEWLGISSGGESSDMITLDLTLSTTQQDKLAQAFSSGAPFDLNFSGVGDNEKASLIFNSISETTGLPKPAKITLDVSFMLPNTVLTLICLPYYDGTIAKGYYGNFSAQINSSIFLNMSIGVFTRKTSNSNTSDTVTLLLSGQARVNDTYEKYTISVVDGVLNIKENY